MIERLPMPLAHLSADERYRYVNGAFEALAGLPRAAIIGRTPGELPRQLGEGAPEIESALNGHAGAFDRQITTADGVVRVFQVSCLPIRDDTGNVSGCDVMMIDVTEQKRATKALEEREKRRDLAFNSGRLGIWEWDLDAHTVHLSSQFQPGGGNTSVTLDFDDWASYLHPEDRDAVIEQMHEIMRGEINRIEMQFRIVTHSGAHRWLMTRGSLVPPEIRGPRRVVGFDFDITEQKRAEEALRAREEQIRLIIDNVPVLMSYVDATQRVRFINQGYEAWYGTMADTIIGKHLKEVIGDATYRQVWPNVDAALKGQRVSSIEGIESPMGMRKARVTRVPDIDENGKVRGYVALLVDITREEARTEALEAARQASEEADAMKSRYVAAASHDLRQPLQALMLCLDGISQRVKNDETTGLVEGAKHSAEALSSILNALLDVSMLESGKITARPRAFRLSDLLHRIERQFAPQLRELALTLMVVPTTCLVQSDPELLNRILGNYIQNAIQHAGAGKILMGCRRRGNALRIEVWDTGPGVPETLQAEIFREFCQLESGNGDPRAGLGLGLAIVDGLAKLLEHQVGMRSTPGKGSVFYIDVPVACGRYEPAATPDEELVYQSASGKKGLIFCVDDDETTLQGLGRALTDWGHEVVCAATAEAGLAALRENFDGRPVDLIVSDYRLGAGVTGTEVIAAVRSALGDEDVPAAIITGDLKARAALQISHAGLQVLTKPIRPAKLRALVQYLISAGG